jgi:hypothetical protein
VYTLFIPIAGRAGGNSLPDLLIAVLTAFALLEDRPPQKQRETIISSELGKGR